MTLNELKPFVRQGKWGIIPGWKGYIKWNYSLDQMQFINGNYIISYKELKDKIKNRTDLFYII